MLHTNLLQVPDTYFEQSEMDPVRAALNMRAYNVLANTGLMNNDIMFSKTKIIFHKENSKKY